MAVQIANRFSNGNIRLRMGFNAEMAQRHDDSVKTASKLKNKEILIYILHLKFLRQICKGCLKKEMILKLRLEA